MARTGTSTAAITSTAYKSNNGNGAVGSARITSPMISAAVFHSALTFTYSTIYYMRPDTVKNLSKQNLLPSFYPILEKGIR